VRTTIVGRLAAVFTVLGLLVIMTSPVSAMKPQKISFYVEFEEELCGIPVFTTIDGVLNFHIKEYVIEATTPEANSFWIGHFQINFDMSWTNAAGVTVTNHGRHMLHDGDLAYSGDGNWLYTWSDSGHPNFFQIGNEIIYREVGHVRIAEVIHFGNLSTQADDYIVSSEATHVAGQQPEAESENAFCDVIVAALG
jgi:hypothetical protein